jgi:hypothetical protein
MVLQGLFTENLGFTKKGQTDDILWIADSGMYTILVASIGKH